MMGYSQGTHSPTFAFSEDIDYFARKVNLFIAIGPTIIYKEAHDLMKGVARFEWVLHKLASWDILEVFN